MVRPAFAVVFIVSLGAAAALDRRDDQIFDDEDGPPLCTVTGQVVDLYRVRAQGLPLIGERVRFGGGAKIKIEVPRFDPPRVDGSCRTFYSGLQSRSTAWELLTQPPGSAAELELVGGSMTLPLDRPGRYEVRFAACVGGCEVTSPDGFTTVQISPAQVTVVIDAVAEIVVTPETEPTTPSFEGEATAPITLEPGQFGLCSSLADISAPSWHTVDPWDGAGNYRALEGRSEEARPSTTDLEFNHHTGDFIFHTRPDPPFNNIRLVNGKGLVEVEWERGSFAQAAWPTRGDRVSTVGYFVNDCAHPPKTEIHPPVLAATHRARAVALPASLGYGRDLRVPGIVSKLWVSGDGGEAAGNCSATGLHETRAVFRLTGTRISFNCLPTSKGYDNNPIDSVFTYRIYLPRNPSEVLQDLGRETAEADLYVAVVDESRPGPEPVIVRRRSEDGVSYLEVRIDLRRSGLREYTREIHAAWIHPSPDNWGLRAWRVSIDSLRVFDDMDTNTGPIPNDGDWRMWVNVNNTSGEWTQIFDCGGCVQKGVERFGGQPWQTGGGPRTRPMGPDLLLFKDQEIWVHTSGFEDDFYEDALGQVNDLVPQRAGRYSTLAGTGVYRLYYRILPGTAQNSPSLTPLGRAVFERYKLRPRQPGRTTYTGPDREWHLPATLELEPDTPPFDVRDSIFFEVSEAETNGFEGISNTRLNEVIAELRDSDPEALATMLAETRAGIERVELEIGGQDAYLNYISVQDALPADLWDQYFGDVDLDALLPESPKTVPLWALLLAIVVTAVLVARLVSQRAMARSIASTDFGARADKFS